jgi:hypothetical protein
VSILSRVSRLVRMATSPNFVESGDRYMRLVFLDAIGRLLKALHGKPELRTAFVGDQPDILRETEPLRDFGFVQEDGGSIFESREDAILRGRSLDALDPRAYDVIVVGDLQREAALLERLAGCGTRVLPLRRLAAAFAEAICIGEARGYRTCLNPLKLALVAASVGLAPAGGAIVEAGVYMGGTTLFISRFQGLLGLDRPVFALDTYEGMPEPSEQDRRDAPFVYEAGMFSDNRKDVVQRYWDRAGATGIRMIQGLVQDTMAAVPAPSIAFMLLDCDQYNGTRGGLDGALPRLAPGGLILIDDSSVVGVSRALDEVGAAHPSLRRVRHITYNFDLVFAG